MEEYVAYVTSAKKQFGLKRSITLYSGESVPGFLQQGEEVFEVRGKRYPWLINFFRGGCAYKDLKAFQKAIDWFHEGSPEKLGPRLRKFCLENRLAVRKLPKSS
jgi:hypothetical protein